MTTHNPSLAGPQTPTAPPSNGVALSANGLIANVNTWSDATPEECKYAIRALLARRGPTTEEAITCWIELRHQLDIDLAVLSMFEKGEVNLARKNSAEDGEITVTLIKREN